MLIDSLTISQQRCHRTISESISDPDWPQIRDALGSLNGLDRVWMTLDRESCQLSVGGGSDGFTVCAYDSVHDTCLCAQPAARLDQQGAYLAVKAFVLGGQLTDQLDWQSVS